MVSRNASNVDPLEGIPIATTPTTDPKGSEKESARDWAFPSRRSWQLNEVFV